MYLEKKTKCLIIRDGGSKIMLQIDCDNNINPTHCLARLVSASDCECLRPSFLSATILWSWATSPWPFLSTPLGTWPCSWSANELDGPWRPAFFSLPGIGMPPPCRYIGLDSQGLPWGRPNEVGSGKNSGAPAQEATCPPPPPLMPSSTLSYMPPAAALLPPSKSANESLDDLRWPGRPCARAAGDSGSSSRSSSHDGCSSARKLSDDVRWWPCLWCASRGRAIGPSSACGAAPAAAATGNGLRGGSNACFWSLPFAIMALACSPKLHREKTVSKNKKSPRFEKPWHLNYLDEKLKFRRDCCGSSHRSRPETTARAKKSKKLRRIRIKDAMSTGTMALNSRKKVPSFPRNGSEKNQRR